VHRWGRLIKRLLSVFSNVLTIFSSDIILAVDVDVMSLSPTDGHIS